MRKTWFVRYLTREEKARLEVLPNWRKLLGWFLRESRKCIIIHIWTEKED